MSSASSLSNAPLVQHAMKQAVEQFLNYTTVERGLSPNTLAAYRNDLTQFVEFLEGRDPSLQGNGSWKRVGTEALTAFVLDLHERGYSDKTKTRKVASTKALFGFLLEEGVIDKNPMEDFASPGTGESLPETLSVEEVEALLSVGETDTPMSLRDRAIIEVMYATGVRVSELVALDIDDIDLDESFVRCMGKGSKERIIPLHDEAVVTVREYLEDGRASLAGAAAGRGHGAVRERLGQRRATGPRREHPGGGRQDALGGGRGAAGCGHRGIRQRPGLFLPADGGHDRGGPRARSAGRLGRHPDR